MAGAQGEQHEVTGNGAVAPAQFMKKHTAFSVRMVRGAKIWKVGGSREKKTVQRPLIQVIENQLQSLRKN